MDRNRQGEIGRAMAKSLIREHGIKVSSELDRDLGNEVKRLNEIEPELRVTSEELAEMYLELSQELMDSFELRIRSKIQNASSRR